MNLCLLVAGVSLMLGTPQVTLRWMHSVEKTVWEEDWSASAAGVLLTRARIQGSGAGMEPPPDARLIHGFWQWQPTLPPLKSVILRRSGATMDWQLCYDGACRSVEGLVPKGSDPVELRLCKAKS